MPRYPKGVFLTEAQLHLQLSNEIRFLMQLCHAYDNGDIALACKMATACYNIVAGDNKGRRRPLAIEMRKSRKFGTIKEPPQKPGISSIPMIPTKLVQFTFSENPLGLSFLPILDQIQQQEMTNCSFVEWWNRDIIYYSNDNPPMQRVKIVDQRVEEMPPLNRKLTRRQFVYELRNFSGAHLDEEITEHLADLLGPGALIFDFAAMLSNGQTVSVQDGTLPLRVPVAAAMMRQISHEVIVAYTAA